MLNAKRDSCKYHFKVFGWPNWEWETVNRTPVYHFYRCFPSFWSNPRKSSVTKTTELYLLRLKNPDPNLDYVFQVSISHPFYLYSQFLICDETPEMTNKKMLKTKLKLVVAMHGTFLDDCDQRYCRVWAVDKSWIKDLEVHKKLIIWRTNFFNCFKWHKIKE